MATTTTTSLSLQFFSNFLPFSSSPYHFQPTSLSFYPSFLLFKNGASSTKHSFICFASTRKYRPSRKLMSDEELCNVLREFVASVGLPDDHIPTTKDLSLHGRKDLANIVRRRGHKSIKTLLSNSFEMALEESETVASGSDLQKSIDGNLDDIFVHEKEEEKVNDLAEESSGTLVTDDRPSENSVVINSEPDVNLNSQRHVLMESQASLMEKVEKFIKYGQLDTVEDDISSDLSNINFVDGSKSSSSEDISLQSEPVMNDEVDIRHSTFSNETGRNGSLMLLSLPVPTTTEDKITRDENLSSQGQIDTDFDGDVNLEVGNMENQVEIDRLKELLHQKELELSLLKEEIEKEKHALAILQTKAESEISKAQSLILEKDVELVAAEESLSGLVEAKIQYSGEGQMVEVAGSFNGWHQRIQLEPDPSSAVIHPIGTSKYQLWSTILWLYPGVYEIKFIVDGQWKIDPQLELTNKDGIENNLLRVDR